MSVRSPTSRTLRQEMLRKIKCLSIFICFLVFVGGCGHVERFDLVNNKGISKWDRNEPFYIFYDNPKASYKIVSWVYFLSDIGDYPDEKTKIKRAKHYAQKYGGNGAIVYRNAFAPGRREDFRAVKIILINKRNKEKP